MEGYFDIIDEWNFQIINLIEQYNIASNQYFPAYAFAKINENVGSLNMLKDQQVRKLQEIRESVKECCKVNNCTLDDIFENKEISPSYKHHAIIWAILEDKIDLCTIEEYLRGYEDKTTTDYRRILCAYDYKKYK